MSSSFENTRERIQDQVDEGLFTPGAQMSVEIDGEQVLDLAIGESGTGEAMSAEHVFRVYCSIKPITAVAVAQLVDTGRIEVDDPLAPLLPEFTGLQRRGVTLRQVLTHTAGLWRPQALEMEFRPPELRREAVRNARPPGRWGVRAEAGYSEYVGWQILGALIEAITGRPLREYLREVVLDPVGLDSTWVGMTNDEYRAVRPRIGVNADMHDLRAIPMLFERVERVCVETNPAHGGYTNARDLTRFYSAILVRLAGQGSDALPSPDTLKLFTSPARPRMFDQVLGRDCTYGLGFMTDLREHHFGDLCGETSFGHSGNVGTTFGFADPERGLATAVVFNGLVDHEAAFLRRRSLVNALYTDLDEAAEQTEPEAPDAPVATDARPRSRFGFRRRARA